MAEGNRKKALVTGGSGEVGQFIHDSFECEVYDKKNGEDIWNTDILIGRMKGKDLVVHLAAYPHPFIKGLTHEDYMKLNFEGTKHVVACMKKAGVKKLIFMSSGGVYGFSANNPYVEYLPLDEEHPLDKDRLTSYDKSKIACEKYLTNQKTVTAIIFRLEAPGLLDASKGVYDGHLFAHVTRDNIKELITLAGDYGGPSVVLNAGDPTTNKYCPDTIAFAKENYPDAEIRLKSPEEPLISIEKAKKVLGYVGKSALNL